MARAATTALRVLIALACALVALVVAAPARALDDGLARTPPMGFNNWNDTGCSAAFNESYVKAMADLFVSTGLKDRGYQYINLDDCWARPQNSPEGSRDADGHLVPDPVRFPNGIKALADYVHSKGLKLGIYTDAGTRTCNGLGFDGILGPGYTAGAPTYERIDAQDFADWGVDYVKFDWCNVPLSQVPGDTVDDKARLLYTKMSDALRATGRPIVFSIATLGDTRVSPWVWGPDVGHLWRTTGDIGPSYASMSRIAKFNLTLAQYAGPGHWNDPDMLQVGNGSWSVTEQRTHFSLWGIMAAPLLIGTDLREATPDTMDILRNKDVIAVDQDRLGKQGHVVRFDQPPPPEATRSPGPAGFGSAVRLNGPEPNKYVELPGGIVGGLTDFTVAAWVNRATTSGQTWARVFDFGSGTAQNMFLTVNAGGAGLRFAITTTGSGGEQRITAPAQLPTGWHHVAVTLSGSVGTLYVDGQPVATNPNMTLRPSDLGATTQNWIGRSQYGGDPPLDATVDDFQIYNRALSQADVQSLTAVPGGDAGGGNVAWYRFDEDGGATALDSSGNGRDGRIVTSSAGEGHYVIAKPLANGDVAVALWNDTSSEARISTSASEIGAPPTRGFYRVRDLWTKKTSTTTGAIAANVPSHGTAMLRVAAQPPSRGG